MWYDGLLLCIYIQMQFRCFTESRYPFQPNLCQNFGMARYRDKIIRATRSHITKPVLPNVTDQSCTETSVILETTYLKRGCKDDSSHAVSLWFFWSGINHNTKWARWDLWHMASSRHLANLTSPSPPLSPLPSPSLFCLGVQSAYSLVESHHY